MCVVHTHPVNVYGDACCAPAEGVAIDARICMATSMLCFWGFVSGHTSWYAAATLPAGVSHNMCSKKWPGCF